MGSASPLRCIQDASKMQQISCSLSCVQATPSRKATGVLAAVSSSPTGQTTSKTLQLVIHAPVVVSSCGAIHTPALLLRSGITGGGNVGGNLRLHPATGVISVFERNLEQQDAGSGAVEMHKVCVLSVRMAACGLLCSN
jgi:hypothetical protein